MLRNLPDGLAEALTSISLNFALEQFLINDTPAVQNWTVEAVAHHWDEVHEDGSHREESVAHMHFVRGSLVQGSLWQKLDSQEGDLEVVASAVLDLETGDLQEEILEQLAGSGSSLLILNAVQLSQRCRGYGVGALLAGQAILALDGDASGITAYPAPLDGSTGTPDAR